MSYMHIANLYKAREILLFKECYALEKIHGTSAHVGWDGVKVHYFSGGSPYSEFVKLFDPVKLQEAFELLNPLTLTVWGEAYGGKLQGMRETYGDKLRFVAFEVKVGDSWLSVPEAEKLARDLGFDFVPWEKIGTSQEELDQERDSRSIQAVKNGCEGWKKREGIVLRPLVEMRLNNGERVIAKYKVEEFRETKKPRPPFDEEKLAVLKRAEEICGEWITEMRLTHVLDKFPGAEMEKMGEIIRAMVEDVQREAGEEIEQSKEARKLIGKKTAQMFKKRLQCL
jgi:hypothetical protein